MATINGPANGGAYIPGTEGDDTINAYGNGNSLYGGSGINFLYARGGSDNSLVGGPGIDHMDGGSGIGNLASYQLSHAPVVASLANPSINTGDARGDTYAGNIHGLTGSPQGGALYADNSGQNNQLWAIGGTNDLFGGTGYTTFISGPGADRMVGGSGGGFADYEFSLAGVTASLINPQVNAGEAAGDTYSNIHNIGGSGFDDVLYADNFGSNMLGGAGNNIMYGGAGNDTVNGGPGANTLYGRANADWFIFGGSAIGPGDVPLDPLLILDNARRGIFSTVMDFDQGNTGRYDVNEYDAIDVAPLLVSQYHQGKAVGSLVRIVEDASNTFANFQIDTGGTGSNWLTIAHLNGVPGGGGVRVIFDEAQPTGVMLTVQPAATGPTNIPMNHHNDILWFNSASGQTDMWDISNGHYAASFSAGSYPGSTETVVGVGQFFGGGASDILFQNTSSGLVSAWKIAGGQWAGSTDIGTHPGSGWQVAGTGDFNGDSTSDVLWLNASTGQTDVWQLTNGQFSGSVLPGSHPLGAWKIAATGDFNGDHTSDILWYNSQTGAVDEWTIVNGRWAGSKDLTHPGSGWTIGGAGDFNGDGTSDILFYNAANGQTDIWKMANGNWAGSVSPGVHATGWQVAAVADLDQDGKSDILFSNTQTGAVDEWKIIDGNWAGSVDIGSHPGANWNIAGVGDFAHF